MTFSFQKLLRGAVVFAICSSLNPTTPSTPYNPPPPPPTYVEQTRHALFQLGEVVDATLLAIKEDVGILKNMLKRMLHPSHWVSVILWSIGLLVGPAILVKVWEGWGKLFEGPLLSTDTLYKLWGCVKEAIWGDASDGEKRPARLIGEGAIRYVILGAIPSFLKGSIEMSLGTAPSKKALRCFPILVRVLLVWSTFAYFFSDNPRSLYYLYLVCFACMVVKHFLAPRHAKGTVGGFLAEAAATTVDATFLFLLLMACIKLATLGQETFSWLPEQKRDRVALFLFDPCIFTWLFDVYKNPEALKLGFLVEGIEACMGDKLVDNITKAKTWWDTNVVNRVETYLQKVLPTLPDSPELSFKDLFNALLVDVALP